MSAADGSELDRETVRMRGDRATRQRFHDEARSFKANAIGARRTLGLAFLTKNAELDPGDLISKRTGIGSIDLSCDPLFAQAEAECATLIEARAETDVPTKGSLHHLASGKRDFGENSPSVALALSPTLLMPIIRYFDGVLPVLFSMGVNRAKADGLIETSSHMYHLDPEDTQQIKVFVHLCDVEADRAFYALPADLSETVAHKLNYVAGRVGDEIVDEIVGPGRQVGSIGAKGFASFCDTSRCFHYGGRPGRLTRDILTIQYALPTSTWFPRWPGDGERRNLLPLLTPRAGDATWNALIGAELC
jgi:hypothetical protein